MLSSKKNGLLRALIANSAVISLNSRTLLVCITALVALSLCIYAILNNQFSAQHAERIDQLLTAKAQAIDHNDASGHDHTLAMTPVYYHSGDLEGAKETLHWPKACEHSQAPLGSQIQRFKCGNGIRLHAMETTLSPEQTSQTITLWATHIPNASLLSMQVEDILGLAALVLVISTLCSRWISQSITQPLGEITTSAQLMAEGNYDWRLPESSIGEINQLAFTFNHMARSLQERDKVIRRTAYKDQLTGLDNRAYLTLALRERTQSAREPLSIVIWGIDNLDNINEVLGHDVADKVLIKVARKASRICQENLVIARLEGNIFCMLLPRDLLESMLKKHTLKRMLHGSLRVQDYQLDIQSHAGLAHYPEHGQCPETLMRRAEIARQLAKKTRQTSIVFEARLEQRSANRLELIAQLRQAITDEEFCLFFQPKLNLRTNSINQAEVLLRWNHPVHGLIAPGAFMELAEQTGMIRDITRLVLKQTYAIINLCANQNIRLSVNLSAMDLEDSSLIDFMQHLHRLQPDASRHIVLEITESAAMRDPEQALDILNQLAAMHFQIAVDDFGTGYSSLAYLKRFPVTELKIDRSLVQGADLDTDGQIILESTIEMGHIMGLLVTTEGVETQAEFDLVKKLGADYVQGFWLSKPMPFDEFKLKHLVGNHDQLVQHL
ncbi:MULTISPECIES: bifunctional diguanylate cyclase/phosphodiesterase [unclassified Limnobacter]|jgi:diguanylate cyclase (GGDEF)-like protein|uniref:putative bifunctional diguanylate cyclase/phosphodiesterase n=1 Tax=unclassified Limnobacter TaxID=2630203 RepID=UPI000156CE72|nr:MULTISPECIES: GGDEF domain-containing phosphodiesterase [unclassified Limnobacter]EDM83899.1 putative signalling protein [Limnobacter sp. MED105]